MTTEAPRTFTAAPGHWHHNKRTAKVIPAILNTPDGDQIPGVHIFHAGAWIVTTEANAVQIADDILNVIESRDRNAA
ncbi:hypothetical protein [Arthrobacter sp. H35-D1]|uniref:hypothetical protein n=1 Tax=Arthrobacter sp. H35-D1 TaxID=3046202 RepID=UPI0024BA0D39|nr:hypothetical protein [Arthrobacter sp. H35-D1]MDJ0311678.1 hypothetical protein [Arthrobacter sp. H35-D1]